MAKKSKSRALYNELKDGGVPEAPPSSAETTEDVKTIDGLKATFADELTAESRGDGSEFFRLLVDRYDAARAKEDDLEKQRKAAGREVEALEMMLTARITRMGLQGVKAKSGRGYHLVAKPYVSARDHAALNEWLEKNGLGDMRKINWQSLQSQVTDLFDKGKAYLASPAEYDAAGVKVKDAVIVGLPSGTDIYFKESLSRAKA